MKTYRVITTLLLTCVLFLSCNSAQEQQNTSSSTENASTDERVVEPSSEAFGTDEQKSSGQTECRNLKTFKMMMDKYREATEIMNNNGDGLDFTRLGSISTSLKMSIQSYDRAGSQSMSPECWEEYQRLKTEFEIICLSNQATENEHMDVDMDYVID